MSLGDFNFLKDLGFVECDLELEKSLQKWIQLNLMQHPDPSLSLDMIPMPQPHFDILSDQEAWQRLPAGATGAGQPLPSWARMLAGDLPRTTAALLELDLAQRTASPIPAGLRAAMRWVAADTNRCAYSLAYAEADAIRSGVHPDRLLNLRQDGLPNWSKADRAALQFARKMSEDSDSVTDDEFAALVQFHGERQAASMVLLMAYANFQDRLLLCLGATLENAGPMPPLAVRFPANAFVAQTTSPPKMKPDSAEGGATEQSRSLTTSATSRPVTDDADWAADSYDVLQKRLEAQRGKPTRLRVPEWDDIVAGLPEGMHLHGDIIWYRIVFGYASELAVPFELVMRTAGAEGNQVWDRIFGQSLFWVTTKAVKCPYCMGHCEMNFEVAGLKPDEIASRTRLLGSDDWSSFSPAEQQAFGFARKLANTPWEVSQEDVHRLQQNFGSHLAMLVMLNASRYHYMTRISNGFQLTLERTNVFYGYWRVPPPTDPAVTLLTHEECWQRMPTALSGTGQPLPVWVRAVANHLPRTAATMLLLDYVHRTQSPLDPVLRAKMRWVVAHANRCDYSAAYAIADLVRVGAPVDDIRRLQGDPTDWPDADRLPLEFARLLTVAAPTIPDELFEQLRVRHGNTEVAAMVLLAAYGNFQDRIVLGLKLPLEEGGPLPPLDVTFDESSFQMAPFVPTQDTLPSLLESGETVVVEDPEWAHVTYEVLQSQLNDQRMRQPRLPVPSWEVVKQNLPPAAAARPTRIVWNLVCSGYVPGLAIPWSRATRTMWAEFQSDRVFEESLFWIQTRSIGCNYCMGHCEMLLEVAGLDKPAVAERTRLLAGADWSAFPPTEQRAYAYARKLSRTPWELTADDFKMLESDLGSDQAMAIFWWLCRGLYMTRVSDGFQLPLEHENVFQPLPAASDRPSAPTKSP